MDDVDMRELRFGTDVADPVICPEDRAFLDKKSFARGEIRLPDDAAPALTAYQHVRARRFAEAVATYDEIIIKSPDLPEIWVNRGVALQALNHLEDALVSFDRSLTIRKDYAAGLINRGVVLGWMLRNAEALAAYDRAIELEPHNEAGLLGRAVILAAMGRYEDSLHDSELVLAANPGSGAAHYNRALVLLSMGEYAEGFREHEWRFGTNAILGRYQFGSVPRWTGQRTKKRILVHCEQGLGDQIQFARYLPMMAARGLDVALEAPPVLIRLLWQLGVPVATHENREPDFGYHCPIISLAAVFGTTLDSVPQTRCYLRANTKEAEGWKNTLGAWGTYPRVGLCWSSGVRPDQVVAVAMQKRKSIPTAALTPLTHIDGINFVSLQKDMPEGGIPVGLIDPMPKCNDLAATSAVIANLDLVITVDSAVAHLAGAMGKPVWVLNRYDICWRWLSGSKPSPWYDSARIYRQSAPGRWDDVIANVRKDLIQWASIQTR